MNASQYAPPMVMSPRPRGGAMARAYLSRVTGVLGPALGNVFLIPNASIGLLLWVALASNPQLAALGLLGLGGAIVGMRLLGIDEEARVGGGLKANTLLAAVAAGWMASHTYYPLHIQLAIAAVASVAAFGVTASIIRALEKSEFPALLWGYCIVAGALFAVFPTGARLAAEANLWWTAPLETPLDFLLSFLRSLGSLMFAPNVQAGIVVALGILLWSRIAFACGVIGWLAGVAAALALQEMGVRFLWLPASYNFFVAGMALGATYFLPSVPATFLAAISGGGTALVAVGLQHMIPAFAFLPVSSALAIWIGIGSLALAGERSGFVRNGAPSVPPEEARWRTLLWQRRLGDREPLLVVPVSGAVKVTQSFDGPLSHKGPFRHALDFQRPLPTSGAIPVSIWESPVLSPAAGIVERVRDGVVDNPVGVANYAESWGNYVCIRLEQGGWAMLAHLRQGSISVSPGARVEIGSYLGTVGNSGRSPVSHLHMQVQSGPQPGAPTVPFRLANFQSGLDPELPLTQWNAAAIPAHDILVSSSAADPVVHATLASLAPGNGIWSVESQGEIPRSFREKNLGSSAGLTRHLDALGRHVFHAPDGAELTLAFAPDAWRIVEQRGGSPLLRLLALSVPTIPFSAQVGMTWSDFVPATLAATERWIKFPLAPYRWHPFVKARSVCSALPGAMGPSLAIETELRSHHRNLPLKLTCHIEPLKGPTRIEATFERGSLTYALVSFQPGQPFDPERPWSAAS